MNSKSPIRDIMHFFGIEEENVIKSTANLGEGLFLIHNLDILYKSCLELEPINKPELKIPTFLFLNSHREFYLGAVSFFRLHQSKSFCNLRSALDSAFTGYYLLKHPKKIEVYLSKISGTQSKEWNKLFLNIKETIKKDIKNFPYAEGLPEIHELCSVYAHSDPVGIMQRYNIDKEKLMLEVDYFDYEENLEDYDKWLGVFLFYFFKIFLIFWNEMFKQRAGNSLKQIEQRMSVYREKLQLFMKEHPLRKTPALQ